MIAYLAILSTAVAAFFGAPVWAILPGAAVLLSISLSEQRKLSARFAAINASYVLDMAHWQSAVHAAMASAGAFAIGWISRLVW